jgi:hypothetical protein
MVKLMARTWANNIEGAIWYTLNGPGWREGGLLNSDNSPLPAYTSLAFMSEKLKMARFNRSIGILPVEGYEFEDSSRIYRLYWTNNVSQTGLIPVPVGIQAVYDIYGQTITHGGFAIPISTTPVIVVLGK